MGVVHRGHQVNTNRKSTNLFSNVLPNLFASNSSQHVFAVFCCRDFTEYSAERKTSCRVAQMFAVPIFGTPCKPCHPFAPVHPRATEAGQKLGQPMASCLVKRVTRSHPYIPGQPRLARNLADPWHHALSSVSPVRTRTFPGDRGWPETWPAHGIMPCKPCHPFAPVHPRATALDPSIFAMHKAFCP